MLHLHSIRPRIPRLRELVAELVQEYLLVQSQESPLRDGERRAYLIGIQEAIAGLDQARVVLGKAVRRVEDLGLPSELTWRAVVTVSGGSFGIPSRRPPPARRVGQDCQRQPHAGAVHVPPDRIPEGWTISLGHRVQSKPPVLQGAGIVARTRRSKPCRPRRMQRGELDYFIAQPGLFLAWEEEGLSL